MLFFLLSPSSRIDQKVSNSPYGYRLQEAQAILTEVRSIRDAISSGEKEKQELMQVKVPGWKQNVLFFFVLSASLGGSSASGLFRRVVSCQASACGRSGTRAAPADLRSVCVTAC